MLTDIRSVLMENKINAEETVYAELPKAITEYPLTIGDFNTVISGQETVEQFSVLLDSKTHFFTKLDSITEYAQCEEQIRKLSKALKTKQGSAQILDWEERTKLKQEKKRLEKRKKEIIQNLEKEMIAEYGSGQRISGRFLFLFPIWKSSGRRSVIRSLSDLSGGHVCLELMKCSLNFRGRMDITKYLIAAVDAGVWHRQKYGERKA